MDPEQVAVQLAEQQACDTAGSHQSNVCTLITRRARYKVKTLYPERYLLIPCFYLAGMDPEQVAVQHAEQQACGIAGSHQSNICTLITFRARYKVNSL